MLSFVVVRWIRCCFSLLLLSYYALRRRLGSRAQQSVELERPCKSNSMESRVGDPLPKLVYTIVTDEDDSLNSRSCGTTSSFRYTRPVLQSTLQIMGCKPRHAFKISKQVFEIMRNQSLINGKYMPEESENMDDLSGSGIDDSSNFMMEQHAVASWNKGECFDCDSESFQLYKRQTTLTVKRERFLDIVCETLSEYKYVGPNQRADLIVACRIRERKDSMTILLCGTSGCGKSTLSALLASRLGITTVVSSDSIRHMMRGFTNEKESPLLFASTYHAGECLDPKSVAEARAKKKVKKLAGSTVNGQHHTHHGNEVSQENFQDTNSVNSIMQEAASVNSMLDSVSPKVMAIEGYKAQSEMVIDSLDRLITSWETRKESVVVEGVHLSLSFVMGLMKKHPSIIPFMIYISDEEKHLERFAVRAKYMTLDPSKNKYAKYIRNIRAIQEYLCKRADKHLVPKVSNNNVDKSVAAIHATVFSCLRRRNAGEQLYDSATNTARLVEEEYRNQCALSSISAEWMFQLIKRRDSFRHLMGLPTSDEPLAKAPALEASSSSCMYGETSTESSYGNPTYQLPKVGKLEHFNLHFGNFGFSGWSKDIGGTSYSSSIDGSRLDGTETSSIDGSTTPVHSEGRSAKEHAEDFPTSSTDEEPDDTGDMDADTDDDISATNYEMEGSVDEESAKSDEDYEDLAINDGENEANDSCCSVKENVDTNSIEVGFKCLGVDSPGYLRRQQSCNLMDPFGKGFHSQFVVNSRFGQYSNGCKI